jgi:hypothetical protein
MKMPRGLPKPDYQEARASPKLQPHILDYLTHIIAANEIDKTLENLHATIKAYKAYEWDADLVQLFNCFDEGNKTRPEWHIVRRHLQTDIELLESQWSRKIKAAFSDGEYVAAVGELYEEWCQIQPFRSPKTDDFARSLLDEWSVDRSFVQWELLKASFAFKMYYKKGGRFVWQMAGAQLGILKFRMQKRPSDAIDGLVIPDFYAGFKLDRNFVAARRSERQLTSHMGHMNASDSDYEDEDTDTEDDDDE